MISVKALVHQYLRHDESGQVIDEITALDGIELSIQQGEYVAILGHNGSGKSTLAKHLNGILKPTKGTVLIAGKDTREDGNMLDIRQKAGMVFQNPDNQIVATIVEEDVAFGPENIGVPTEEIWQRVARSLDLVGMAAYRTDSPNRLSGGQKQRIAIAGVVAMEPDCMILDEATAMLDPEGRKDVTALAHQLNREKNITIIHITHHMDEVVNADRIYVMSEGKVVMMGTPRDIFSQVEQLEELGLTVPESTKIGHLLSKAGVSIPKGVLGVNELINALQEVVRPDCEELPEEHSSKQHDSALQTGLQLCNVSYQYHDAGPSKTPALHDINLSISKGEFVAIIGHTGASKSTLIQHFNALLAPSAGKVLFEGKDVHEDGFSKKYLRSKVGMTFQYPENQLFEETVLKDVAFGPLNMGYSREEAYKMAQEALRMVNMPERYDNKSPFELSGGQKRRVAIAGVLAMKPEFLVLDEPTAGLDPRGCQRILRLIDTLHKEQGVTMIMVSHNMEDVARYANRVIVMNEGRILFDDTPECVFAHETELHEIGLAVPEPMRVMKELRKKGIPVRTDSLTIEDAVKEISRVCYAISQ
ncbi:MAG: energy-coupling factor transporter ATPase [Lachnospiraceae bacterium]